VERQRRERVAEEASLRDKLIRNVQQLEQQRKEIQRELVLRDMSGRPSSSSQRRRSRHEVPSAVVVPRH
jgi:type III secretory pathway component EscU